MIVITKNGAYKKIHKLYYIDAQGYTPIKIYRGKSVSVFKPINILKAYVFDKTMAYAVSGISVVLECKPNTTYILYKKAGNPVSTNRFRVGEDSRLITEDMLKEKNYTLAAGKGFENGSSDEYMTYTTNSTSKYLYIFIGNIYNKISTDEIVSQSRITTLIK